MGQLHLGLSGLDSFSPGRTPFKDGEEFFSQLVEQFDRGCVVDVVEPLFVLSREWDLVVGPLAGEVNANARHNRRRISEAHRSEVETGGGGTTQIITPWT